MRPTPGRRAPIPQFSVRFPLALLFAFIAALVLVVWAPAQAPPEATATASLAGSPAVPAGAGASATAGAAAADDGLTLKSPEGQYTLSVNGLFQLRYTGFKASPDVVPLGGSDLAASTFDVYLGRVALSGSVFDPSLKYFLQFQGSSVGNGSGIAMLDYFVAKSFSPGLTLQMGKFWSPFTYEYNDNPGNYLFPDLSSAEYAFVLPRVIGAQVSGEEGRVGYAGVIANSISALDAGGAENFNSHLAYIGNGYVNILAPYGGVETDPNPAGAAKPELTLWASAAYNPVSTASGFENETPGDRNTLATATLGFRYGYFTLQNTGYFRRTRQLAGTSYDSSGFGEQAGYYVVPGRLELAQRVSGVIWGAPDFTAYGPSNTWFAGPNFVYRRSDEYSGGVNYYLHGHHAKIQASYSHLAGATFTGAPYSGNRVWIQTQLMF